MGLSFNSLGSFWTFLSKVEKSSLDRSFGDLLLCLQNYFLGCIFSLPIGFPFFLFFFSLPSLPFLCWYFHIAFIFSLFFNHHGIFLGFLFLLFSFRCLAFHFFPAISIITIINFSFFI